MIHLASGEVNIQFEDFRFFSPVPMIWIRSYHSFLDFEGPLGPKWHTGFDQHIRLDLIEGSLHWLRKDGTIFELPALGIGEEAIIRSDRIWYKRTENSFLVRDLDEEFINHYESIGEDRYLFKLVAITYRSFRLDLEYNSAGELEQVTDPGGRTIALIRNEKRLLTTVELETQGRRGRKKDVLVSYEYNDDDELVSVTDSLGQSEKFVYENGLLVQRIDRNEHSHYWGYEDKAEEARCIKRWQTGGLLLEKITYEDGQTSITNALGHPTIYKTKGDLVVEEIDALGHSLSWEHNEEGEVVSYTDAIGNVTYYDYDDFGNLVATTQPNGGSQAYVYEDHKLVMAKNPLGAIWVWTYDEDGFLESRIGPDNDITRYTYENDLLSEVIDANGLKTRLLYNEYHGLEKIILPNGSEASWEYNERGELTIARNPDESKAFYEYDSLGRVTRIRGADGNRTLLEYDRGGNVVKARDHHHSIEFTYRPTGRLLSRKENNTEVGFKYNRLDQLTAISNEHDSLYRFRYDNAGQMIEESGFDGLTRKLERNPAGEVIKIRTPDDRDVFYKYDKLGNVQQIEYHDGSEEVFVYDRAGNLIEAVNEHGSVKMERDKVGRLLKESVGLFEVESTYNRLGQRIRVRSSLGADIKIDRDKEGNISSTSASNGGTKWEAQFGRDLVGLELERNLPGGVSSRWTRDSTGKPIEHQVVKGGKAYRDKHYHWEVNDRLKSITDGLTKGMVRFNHDLFGNLASAQYEDGSWDFKLPDEVGNLFRTLDRKDREYGPAGQLLKDESYEYSYDEVGNLVRKEGVDGKWEYRWGPNGMLKEVVRPDRKSVFFTYDAMGRRLSKTFEGNVTHWVWDGSVPLHEWTIAEADTISLLNDSGELEFSLPDDAITWIFDEGTFRPSAKLVGEESFSIISDYLGKPEQMYNGEGELVWEAEYDIYGKVRKLRHGSLNDCPFRYPGQYEDEESGLYYNRFRYYDPVGGGYISQDPIRLAGNNPTLYAYVKDSNKWIDFYGLDCLPPVKKAVNSNLPHAADRGVERGVFSSAKDATEKLKELSKKITKDKSWPDGAFLDPSKSNRVLVPVGDGGLAVYQVANNATAKLKTVLIAY